MVHQAAWSGRPTRILTPARPLTGLAVTSPLSDGYGTLAGSRADLLRLGAWARIAATSPHTVVYLPLAVWRGAAHDPVELRRSVDLVLTRIGGAPRPSQWPALRRQLRHGRPATVDVPAPRPVRDRDVRDCGATFAEHATTLFVTGTQEALSDLGDTLTSAAERVSVSRDIHRHGTGYLADVHGPDADDRWEFVVVGVDPAFHQRRRAALGAPDQPPADAQSARAAALTVRRAPARNSTLARTGRHLGR